MCMRSLFSLKMINWYSLIQLFVCSMDVNLYSINQCCMFLLLVVTVMASGGGSGERIGICLNIKASSKGPPWAQDPRKYSKKDTEMVKEALGNRGFTFEKDPLPITTQKKLDDILSKCESLITATHTWLHAA